MRGRAEASLLRVPELRSQKCADRRKRGATDEEEAVGGVARASGGCARQGLPETPHESMLPGSGWWSGSEAFRWMSAVAATAGAGTDASGSSSHESISCVPGEPTIRGRRRAELENSELDQDKRALWGGTVRDDDARAGAVLFAGPEAQPEASLHACGASCCPDFS